MGRHPERSRFSGGATDLDYPQAHVHPSQTNPSHPRYTTGMQQPRRFHVYIMTNNPKSAVLYIGITGDLRRRVWQHKNKLVPGFTSRYNLTRLMYYEQFVYPDAAISREKEIKGWRRSKKIALIESMNPTWDDLAKEWQDVYKPAPGGMTHRDPSPRW
jgi:putative endonuclease